MWFPVRNRQTKETGGPRDTRPSGPALRLFGRPHSIPTEIALPARSAVAMPASIQADYGVIAGTGIELRAASVRGLSHRADPGQVRQDSYAWSSSEGRLFVAVADGVGSAPHSQIGAWTATRSAIELVSSGLGDPRTLGTVVAARITAVAREMGVEPASLATTLTVAFVRIGDENLPWRVAVAEWGDSHASVFSPGKVVEGHPDWRRVTDEKGPVLANDVHSLPFRREATAWGSTMLAPGEVLLVATDGIDAHLRAENSVGHGLGRSWTRPPSIAQFLCDVDFERVGARDDRTAVAVFRPAVEIAEASADQGADDPHLGADLPDPHTAAAVVRAGAGHVGGGRAGGGRAGAGAADGGRFGRGRAGAGGAR